jgi:hypothetical protein
VNHIPCAPVFGYMARSRSNSTQKPRFSAAAGAATLARALPPEDIRRGDYVALLYEVFEYPSWFWCDDSALLPREEVVRIRYTPRDEAAPLKVRAVCLPFVLVREPSGRERTLDVRRVRLARLDREYAAAAWKAYKAASKKRSGGSGAAMNP